MSCESPLGRRTLRRSGRRLERKGVQGGVAARRSAAEPDELRIRPGSSVTQQEGTTNVDKRCTGGVAARRSAAEPDELRIPPGSWNAPKERTTSGRSWRCWRGEAGPVTFIILFFLGAAVVLAVTVGLALLVGRRPTAVVRPPAPAKTPWRAPPQALPPGH